MIATGISIGDNTYDLSTPNDLLFSPVQRIEIQRHPGLYVQSLEDTALVTVKVAWKGFTQIRHYNVPWTGGSGWATVFPDFAQIGFSGLHGAHTDANVEVKLYDEVLASGTMRVASQPARAFDTLDLGVLTDCGLLVAWLDEQGTRYLLPVSPQSVANNAKSVGYSPSGAFSTQAAGNISVFRRWRETSRYVTLASTPIAQMYLEYVSTIGETPFIEIYNRTSQEVYLYDEITVGAVNLNGNLASVTLSVSGLKSPLL